MASSAIHRAVSLRKADKDQARGAKYPRANVIRDDNGNYRILLFTSPADFHMLENDTEETRIFDYHTAAFRHAQREVHALRARRHPAGQSWLRGDR